MNEKHATDARWRWVVTGVTNIFSLELWYFLLTQSLSYPIGPQDYGAPIAFRRMYHPDIELHFPQALVFDLVVAAITIFASCYSFWRWSASWSPVVCFAYAVTIILTATVPIWGSDWVPLPLGLLILVVALLTGPVAWVCSLAYVSWVGSRRWLGEGRGFVLPACLGIVLFVSGRLCIPHDIFYGNRRSDTPSLLEKLKDKNPHLRSLALSGLRGLGPYDEITATAIVEAMSDSDESVRSNAISLASDLGPYAVRAVPVLRDHFIKNGGCTFELGRLGPIAKDAVPALREKLPAAEGYSKLGICGALWKIDGETTLIVPALIDLLTHDYGPIRVDAAKLLGDIGPAAKDAVPLLKEMVAYVPEKQPPAAQEKITAAVSRAPTVREMSESEFYPRIRSAAEEAIQKITPPE